MSWSVTIDDLQQVTELPPAVLAKISEDNPEYEQDAVGAFVLAKVAGLASAALSGGRTPNPYAKDEVVNFSIVGHTRNRQFTSAMQQTVVAPDIESEDDLFPEIRW